MKLVTGIEAIQSGKPWRHRNRTDFWITNDLPLRDICANELLIKQYVIKEEPKEFWINILAGQVYTELPFNIDLKDDNWIRAREVEK